MTTSLSPGQSTKVLDGYVKASTITATANTGTYNMSGSGATVDLGAANLYRYVNAQGVYNAGYSKGYAEGSTRTANAKVTYTAKHTHGDYCYPIATKIGPSTNSYMTWNDDYEPERTYDSRHHVATYTCSVCNKTFSWDERMRTWGESGENSYYMEQAIIKAENEFNAHLVGGRCTAGGYKCGKSTGTYTTTNATTLGEGDSIVSAVINF